jgi:hypothetical protein
MALVVYPPQRSLLERLLGRSSAPAPEWLRAFLKRWPIDLLSRGGYFRLMPYSLEVR